MQCFAPQCNGRSSSMGARFVCLASYLSLLMCTCGINQNLWNKHKCIHVVRCIEAYCSQVPRLMDGDRVRFSFLCQNWFQWWISEGFWNTRIHHGITEAMTASSMVRVCPSVEISLSVTHLTWSPSKQIKICFSPNWEYCISIVLGKDIAHLAWRGCQYGPERYERLMKLRQAKQPNTFWRPTKNQF